MDFPNTLRLRRHFHIFLHNSKYVTTRTNQTLRNFKQKSFQIFLLVRFQTSNQLIPTHLSLKQPPYVDYSIKTVKLQWLFISVSDFNIKYSFENPFFFNEYWRNECLIMNNTNENPSTNRVRIFWLPLLDLNQRPPD